jgi:hypothetical protein
MTTPFPNDDADASSLGLYVLDGRTPRRVTNFIEWATEFEQSINNKQVALTELGDVTVSTVFIGIDSYAIFHGQAPQLFETMIFGGPLDMRTWRYTTWDEAEAGHENAVREAKNGQQ